MKGFEDLDIFWNVFACENGTTERLKTKEPINPIAIKNLTNFGKNTFMESRIEIRDLTGKLIFKEMGIKDSYYKLNCNLFPSGIYSITWLFGDQSISKTLQVIH